MASATPADDVPGRNTSASEEAGFGDLVHHAGWPKVADAVIEAESFLIFGAQGVCGGTLEERVHVRALPVPIVPTTAAGDALHGMRTVGCCPQGYHARRKGHHGQ